RKDLQSEELLASEQALPTVIVQNGQGEYIGQTITVPVHIEGRSMQRPTGQSVSIGKHVYGNGILLRPEEEIRVITRLPNCIEAPVTEGQMLGEIQYMLGEEVCQVETMVAGKTIPRIDFQWCLLQVLNLFFI
ncbi:MAG: hypothetical protein J6Z33_03220, partial [Lachnospiraceae bacterium]|nr:hypothetical protein [Lachnospiraceae bacterium]